MKFRRFLIKERLTLRMALKMFASAANLPADRYCQRYNLQNIGERDGPLRDTSSGCARSGINLSASSNVDSPIASESPCATLLFPFSMAALSNIGLLLIFVKMPIRASERAIEPRMIELRLSA